MSQESIHTSCSKPRTDLQTRIYSYYSSRLGDLLQLQIIQGNLAVLSLRFWTCAILFKLDALSVQHCHTSGQSFIKFVQARTKESGCSFKAVRFATESHIALNLRVWCPAEPDQRAVFSSFATFAHSGVDSELHGYGYAITDGSFRASFQTEWILPQ